MAEDTSVFFNQPAVARKKVRAAFDGDRITSDGGVMLRPQQALALAAYCAAGARTTRTRGFNPILKPDHEGGPGGGMVSYGTSALGGAAIWCLR
jgi:hypothetical protein